MKFLVSTGYAWNRVRTLVLGLAGKLLILANNLNLRFVGNTTVITQQIRNAWDSYGLPFPQMLLNAAWFHNEPISDTKVVDETPNVDASRPAHKARALQFTGAEHIDIPLKLHYAQSTWKVEFEFIFEEHTSRQYIFDSRVSPSTGAAMSIRATGNIPDLLVYNGSGYASVALSQGLVSGTRYKGYAEYDGTRNKLFIEGITDTPQQSSTYTQVDSNTTFRIGTYIGGGSGFIGSIGWMRITQDNIVTAEYAFEEGEGTTCYNRVMNNFHGTISNATISTFRVEDVRITNGDQGTFLNTDGYSPLNVQTSDFSGATSSPSFARSNVSTSSNESVLGVDDTLKITLSGGASSHYIYAAGGITIGQEYKITFDYYIPSGQTLNYVRVGVGSPETTFDTTGEWVTGASFTQVAAQVFYIFRFTSSAADGNVFYIKNIVVTQPNVYVPRPRVTDIPLYNAGKYAYYIPNHTNNFIELNTAFAGYANPGDWMEFGIATVGTGEPDFEAGSWAVSTGVSDNSSFYVRLDDADFRFYGRDGGNNRVQVGDADIINEDFYSFRVTKNQNVGSSIVGVGTVEVFDRNGNLIATHQLTSGSSGNQGVYSFDKFFPSTYSTDFILAYLRLSDGTVWNGANDFNGGVNITNNGTGNITKIFFESVDEDVLGNKLTYRGQVAQPLSLVNSNGVRFGDQEQVELTNDLTVSDFTEIAYVYFDSTLQSAGFMRALFFYDTGTATDGWVTIENNELRYANSVTSNQSAYGYTVIPNFLDTWQKVGISRTGNEIVIVVGDEVRTVDISAVAAGTNTFEAIGRFSNNPQGDLAWISFHSKGMTAEEIKRIDPYNMDTDSLEVFYAPSVGSGSTIYDLSGNNNHGTITNATLSDFWIKQDQFHWNLKKGFDYYTRFADDVNQVQYNERLTALDQNEVYTIRAQFYFAGFPYPDLLGRGESYLFSADIDGTVTFAIWIEGNTSSATFNVGYFDGSTYHTVLLLNPMKPGPYYLEIVKNSPGYDFTSISLNGDNIDLNQAGTNFTPIIYQTGIGCRAVDASADRRWYGGIKFFEIVGQHYLSEDNGFVDTIGNLTLDVPNTEISTKKDRIPYAPPGRTLSNPAGKWHNDAETEINFPHTAKLHMINEQFNYKPFFYKNAQLDDATAAYSVRKVIADYEGPLVNVVRSSDLQAQDFYPDSRGDLDTTAITNFVNESGPVLDDYTGAAAAYSLRKLRTAYTGDAIEVRRSSDGDVLNVGFDANGDLDTTILLGFVGNNLCSNPNEWANGAAKNGWAEIAGTICTFVENVTDADGGTNATRITRTATGSGTFRNTLEGYLQEGEQYTFSVYLRSTNSAQVRLDISDQLSSYIQLDSTWTLYTHTITEDSTPTNWSDFMITSPTDGVVEVYNPMVNHGATALPFEDNASAGAGFAYVTTWYDQTQNDPVQQNNATQSDPAQMPLIVSAGALVTETNGLPAISWESNNLALLRIPWNATSSQSWFGVFNPLNDSYIAISEIPAGGRRDWVVQSGSTSTSLNGFNNQQGTLFINSEEQSPTTRDDLHTAFSTQGNVLASTIDLDNSTWNDGSDWYFFGNGGGVGNLFNYSGRVQEWIVFESDQSTNRTGIEGNIGRYYNIDGFTDGRVATWYDQANANHATQSTPDQQPLIVSDGALVLENSKPAIDFDGVDDFLGISTGPTILPSTGDISSFSVFSGDTSVSGYIYSNRTSTNDRHGLGLQFFSGALRINGAIRIGGTWSIYEEQLMTANQQYLLSAFKSGVDLYVDGTKSTGALNGLFATDSNNFNIGANTNGNGSLNGKLQEMIFYASDETSNRQDIEKNIADYYEITLSGNSGVESWVKNVSFADMYQSWFDYEYLHKLFANFEVPNQVNKILAYVTELTIEQRETIVYPYLKEDYHPIYTPYQQRVQADSGDTDAGKTNTLNKIDNI